MNPSKSLEQSLVEESVGEETDSALPEGWMSTIKDTRAKAGFGAGYPGWPLIYYVMLSRLNPEQDNIIVETGTNWGANTILLAQALKELEA